MTRQGLHTDLKAPTGDPFIDLLACTWAQAFDQAEDPSPNVHIPARAEIVSFFGRERVMQLREHHLISWHPDRVTIQLAMEV